MSYTILYSAEAAACSLNIIPVTVTLPGPVVALGTVTATVGRIDAAAALLGPVVTLGTATVTLGTIIVQGALQAPVGILGAATCTLGPLVVVSTLPGPVGIPSAVTARVGLITVSSALQDLDVRYTQRCTLDAITVQAALQAPTVTLGAITARTGQLVVQVTLPSISLPCSLDPIIVHATLPSLTAILTLTLTVPPLVLRATPLDLTGTRIPLPIPVVYTTDQTWGGIFIARDEPGLTEDRALITAAGFTVALERSEAGETHVYVWGTMSQVLSWTGTRVMLQNQLPYFFWKIPAGLPMTIDLLLRGAAHPGDLIKF